MAKEQRIIDISDIPEIRRLAEEVRESGKTAVLQNDGQDVAEIRPIRPRRRRRKANAKQEDNWLENIIGVADTDTATDVSSNKHKYLADAYASNTE